MATPTPKPSVPANMNPAIIGGNKVKPTKKPTPKPSNTKSADTTVSDSTLRKVPTGVSQDWNAFINGQLVPVPAGTAANGVQSEPYIAYGDVLGETRPTSVVLVGTPDGTGYSLMPIDQAVSSYMGAIPRTAEALRYYKNQLSMYYPSTKALQLSLAQPITEPDDGFEQAIRKSLINLSRDNFQKGVATATYLKDNPSAAKNFKSALTTFDTFVNTRAVMPKQTSVTSRTSSLTTYSDAIAEFMRTVQQYVGDPKLVNNVKILAEAYWNKLHAEELRRVSTGYSVTDPYTGNSSSSSKNFSQLTDVDRLEMRIGFLVKGGSAKDKKGAVQVSTGIKGVDSKALQDAGGLIGDNYTTLIEHSYAMGIKVNDEDLVKRAAEILKPGGSVDEQKNSLTQAAKLIYKSLASYIDSGGKVSDIAATYTGLYESELEKPKGSTDIFNDYVQKALRGDSLPTDNDYIKALRTDESLGWKYTSKANEGSAGFIDTFLKAWGVVG